MSDQSIEGSNKNSHLVLQTMMPVVACILLACSLLAGGWSRNRLWLKVIHREFPDSSGIVPCVTHNQKELRVFATLERLRGKYDLAAGYYRCLIEQDPADNLSRFWLGELLLAEGVSEDQINALWRDTPVVAVIMSRCERAWELAWDTQEAEDWNIAWRKCKWASEIAPENQRAWYFYGRAASKLWKLSESRRALEMAFSLSDSPSSELQYLLASVYRAQKEPQRALNLLQPLVAEFPDYWDARFELGVTMLDLGRCNDALQHLSIAVSAYEKSKNITGRMYLQYAIALKCVGQEAEAYTVFMKALITSPQDELVRERVKAELELDAP